MKLIKMLWKMCGTEKGSCQILCAIITLITAINLALDIVPLEFKPIIVAINIALWVFTFKIDDN